MSWCEEHEYDVVSVVVDQAASEKWPSVVQMLADGEAEVCVTARLDQLSPDRLPRVELIAEEEARQDRIPAQRRPRRARRMR